MLGHNTAFLKFYMFIVSGFFASIAGILLVYLNEFVSPSDVILGASAIPVLMAILGGIGTLIGPVIGAFVIVFLRNWVSLELERWPTLMGLIFILVVLFAREGLVGAVASWWYRRIDKGGRPAAASSVLGGSSQIPEAPAESGQDEVSAVP